MGVLRWTWIPGYERIYRICEDGKIKSVPKLLSAKNGSFRLTKSRIRNPFKEKGYWIIGLYKNGEGKKFGLHRLLAMAFIPNPNNLPEVCHKNDIRTDNRLSNLIWGTRQDNSNMALINGRLKGNRQPKVLPDKAVPLLRTMIAHNVPRKKIAQWFEISIFTVTDIALGRTRKHVL